MKTIILLNGLPRSGKDTLADYLVEKYDGVKMCFAEPLKEVIANTFDISLSDLDNYKNHSDKISIEVSDSENKLLLCTNFRKILQRFGTEGMKPVFGNDVWARLLYKRAVTNKNNLVIVSDFRFLGEYVPSSEYRLISILVSDGLDLPLEGHVSDVELYKANFKFTHEIINHKISLEQYYDDIDKLNIKG